MEQIIGIDLAKRVFQVHIVSTEGEKQANKMITREKRRCSLYVLLTIFTPPDSQDFALLGSWL